jgi:AbrB family looped-hinge helix DNA binding protein
MVTANRWGTGVGVRIPKSFRDSLGIQPGDAVEMTLRGDEVVIRKPVSSNSIESLLAGWDGGRFVEEEVDWGEPTGKEAW